MAVFQRQTRIAAPLERVWSFHSTIAGLERLTPSMADLRVEDIRLPEGSEGDVLVEGTEIDLSVRPVPFGARTEFTSIIVEREEGDGEAFFIDEMRGGPMAEWRHVHSFTAAGEQTLLDDHITFKTGHGDLVDEATRLGMAVGFAYRHRRTREILGQA